MSYKFKLREPLDRGARRIALEQLDRALGSAAEADPALWVHETRKTLKKIRALLRLVRDGLPKTDWRQLNNDLRDAGRLLSRQRDSDVRKQTLVYLGAGADRRLAAAIQSVQSNGPAYNSMATDDGLVASTTAIERLQALHAALGDLKLDAATPEIEHAIARTHRAGRRALVMVRADPTAEQFHDLRKIVQLHWRQMQLLVEAWPDLVKVRLTSARALAQDLGQEHDLATLADWLDALLLQSQAPGNDHKSGASAAAIKRTIAACRIAQSTLREKAIEDARLLFAGRPRAFASEISAYWAAANASERALGRMPTPADEKTPGQRRNSAAPRKPSQKSKPEGGGGDGSVRSKRKRGRRPAPAG